MNCSSQFRFFTVRLVIAAARYGTRSHGFCLPVARLLKWLLSLCLYGMLVWGQAAESASSQEKPSYSSNEQAVLSALLYNFLLFVDWPERNFPSANERWHICTYGDDAVIANLATLTEKPARGHAILLQHLALTDPVSQCHILYLSADEIDRMPQMLARSGGSAALTVADMDGFIERGGMIRLLHENGSLRIGINLASVRAAGLTISARLMSLPQVTVWREGTP